MNELQKALARQQELVTLARNEGRDLTAEEQAEFNRCQAVIDAAGNEGGEAGGQPAGGERGAENAGQGAPAGTTQGGVSDSQRPWRRSASAPPTLWPFAARPAWIRRSTSAAAPAWTTCGRRPWIF